MLASVTEAVLLKRVDPSVASGTVEPIVTGGVEEAARVFGNWGATLANAVPVTDSAVRIRKALETALEGASTEELATAYHEGTTRSIMLGALDASFELETKDELELPEFEAPEEDHGLHDHGADFLLSSVPGFVELPYSAAIARFLELKPVTRKVFDALDAKARVQAFTVAGANRASVVRVVQRELARTIARGEDLKGFRDQVLPRLERAGWSPQNPSHVENVFRTNVARGYSAGRVEHAMKPSVLKLRPVWVWRGVQDGRPRQRDSHKAAHGLAMLAKNPEWATIYPPSGFQCRCRITTATAAKAKVVESILRAVAPLQLVDRGFRAGVSALLAA